MQSYFFKSMLTYFGYIILFKVYNYNNIDNIDDYKSPVTAIIL